MAGRAEILVDPENEDPPTDRDAISLPSSLRLGELLLRRRVISAPQLGAALAEQDAGSTLPLGDLLVRDGVIDEYTLVHALAEQLGLPVAVAGVERPDPESLRCLPRDVAFRLRVLPLSHGDDYLVVATSQPPTPALRQELGVHTQRELRFALTPASVLTRALEHSYPDAASGPPAPDAPASTGARSTVRPPWSHSDRVVDWMLSEADAVEATEVTLDGDADGLKVRYRVVDRVERGLRLPSTAGRILVERVLRAAGLDPDRRDLQSGHGTDDAGSPAFEVLASCASDLDVCRVVVWLQRGSSPNTHERPNLDADVGAILDE